MLFFNLFSASVGLSTFCQMFFGSARRGNPQLGAPGKATPLEAGRRGPRKAKVLRKGQTAKKRRTLRKCKKKKNQKNIQLN